MEMSVKWNIIIIFMLEVVILATNSEELVDEELFIVTIHYLLRCKFFFWIQQHI
jgi:hypothetical protein